MALEQKLSLKLAQKLVMTPTLQQAIKLLQLSRLELDQALSQEVEVNPLLELAADAQEETPGEPPPEEPEQVDEEPSPAGFEEGQVGEPGELSPEDAPPAEPFSEVELDSLFGNYLHDAPSLAPTWEEDEDGTPIDSSAAPEESLFAALCAQVRLQPLPEGLLPICEFIIGNLDAAGYLQLEDEEIAEQLGVAVERVGEAVAVVQRLEPAGLAARTLQECFELQLERAVEEGGGPAVATALRLVREAFDDLLNQRWERLVARLCVSLDEVRASLAVIRRLNPRPGNALGPSDNVAVEPDVQVRKVGAEWRVTLMDDGLPRLRISPRYLRLLQSRDVDTQARGYLRERMRSALWFLRSVEQRQSTILKVTQAIVRRQSGFLEHGPSSLRPMVLKDIADDIGMHESTVSRVVSNKYVATPRGVLPLKYFFHSAISHAVVGDISSVAVKERIKELLAGEDAKRPLSDARIARQLNRTGIRIARRTVAKYREEMGIASSEQRRRTLR